LNLGSTYVSFHKCTSVNVFQTYWNVEKGTCKWCEGVNIWRFRFFAFVLLKRSFFCVWSVSRFSWPNVENDWQINCWLQFIAKMSCFLLTVVALNTVYGQEHFWLLFICVNFLWNIATCINYLLLFVRKA